MTREEAKWAVENPGTVAAMAAGNPIEARCGGLESNGMQRKWETCNGVDFNVCGTREFRVKPTPKLRKWKREEVVLDAWYRNKGGGDAWFRLVSIGADSAGFISIQDGSRLITFSEMFESGEHSTDGGKTWLPCGVMEDAK
jgi:hypothetical protein